MRYDFTVSGAFALLDRNVPINKIDRYEIRDFVELYSRPLTHDLQDCIIRRCDTDEDELLNYAEFSESVKAHSIVTAGSRPMTATSGALNRSLRQTSPLRGYSPTRSTRHFSPVRTRASPVRASPKRSTKSKTKTSTKRRTKSVARHSPLRTTTAGLRERSPIRHTRFEESKRSPVRGGSPLRGYEEEELVDSLKELIDYEREFENLKENLAQRHDFNLTDVFRLFDFTNTGLVTLTDLQQAFNLYSVYPSREEAQLIINRFDNDGDSRLTYSEFQEIFNPKDRYTSDTLVVRPSRNLDLYYPRGDYFIGYTRDDFI